MRGATAVPAEKELIHLHPHPVDNLGRAGGILQREWIVPWKLLDNSVDNLGSGRRPDLNAR